MQEISVVFCLPSFNFFSLWSSGDLEALAWQISVGVCVLFCGRRLVVFFLSVKVPDLKRSNPQFTG